jgi:hypothetical protein
MHALFLLEAGFMRFIDDGDAKVLERQEQRRARADDDLRPAIGNRGPGGAAFTGLQIRMPRHRRTAEARRKAREPRCRQRDFGHEHQRLAALPKRGGNAFEIHLGLA